MRWPYRSIIFWLAVAGTSSAFSQSINSGTLTGVVTDPSGAVIVGASVNLKNAVTGYEQTVSTDRAGAYRFTNVPLNSYHLSISASGFAPEAHDIEKLQCDATSRSSLKTHG